MRLSKLPGDTPVYVEGHGVETLESVWEQKPEVPEEKPALSRADIIFQAWDHYILHPEDIPRCGPIRRGRKGSTESGFTRNQAPTASGSNGISAPPATRSA